MKSTYLMATHDKPLKFPFLLKLPTTNLEWSASFFCLFLPSAYGGWFQVIARGYNS